MIVIGADSETLHGRPMSFQFYSSELKHRVIVAANSKNALRIFFHYLDSLPRYPHGRQYVMFVHNLEFDLIEFFYGYHIQFTNEEFNFEYNGWCVSGVYAQVVFCRCEKRGQVVHLIDTFAYFKSSLAKLATQFCPHLPKLKMPAGLGEKLFSTKNVEFVQYAMRDAEIAHALGEHILGMHAKYQVSLSVSGPHFASRVFRTRYLKKPIPLPSKRLMYCSLHAYHGGKNNITAARGWHKNVTLLDIKSAYPAAMARLPSFSNPDLYRYIQGDGHPDKNFPEFGIYKIFGETKNCPWPIIYSHAFKPLTGAIRGVWTTGPELNEALRSHELTVERIEGYYYDAAADLESSPFKSYVEDMYRLKVQSEGISEVDRLFVKTCLLNSLYGKFIQTRGDDKFRDLLYDLDDEKLINEKIVRGSGLFHPFIASLITGYVRAQIHFLEHKYNALHTATDGIMTQESVVKTDLENKLGGLGIDAAGDALILRTKLYIMYSGLTAAEMASIEYQCVGDKISWHGGRAGEAGVIPSAKFKNKKIIKYAMHGFHGSVYDLEGLYASGEKNYTYTRVNKLRESLRRNLNINAFEQRNATLNW